MLEELQRALTTLASTVLIRLGNSSAPLAPSTMLSDVWKPQGAQPVESRAQLVLRGYHLSTLPDFLEVRCEPWSDGWACMGAERGGLVVGGFGSGGSVCSVDDVDVGGFAGWFR
jgi:hypothetical protein